ADGIVVEEVMLRDIQLPAEYAQGLEGLLLKEQENDRLATETEIEAKRVRIAELQAEAGKAREVKRAEGDAQVHVLQAKAESDAMQYTLPLKEKQIQQSRLEAEARREPRPPQAILTMTARTRVILPAAPRRGARGDSSREVWCSRTRGLAKLSRSAAL